MRAILRVLIIALAVFSTAVLVSMFLRGGDRPEHRAGFDDVAFPIPPWCVEEMQIFASGNLLVGESGLFRVEPTMAPYPYVAAVLMVRPGTEDKGAVILAHEAYFRHCAIREEHRFSGPAALDHAISFIAAGLDGRAGDFVVRIDPVENVVQVINLPSKDR